ncbi:MAG TPA: hypothetical protein VF771_01855 [Longimicrobiaceae bacterium]
MPKLTLRVDDLLVESFEATPDQAKLGTVYAKSDTWEGWGCDSTQYQEICTCTTGGADNTTCDVNLSCGGPETCACAHTDPRYHETCQEGCVF